MKGFRLKACMRIEIKLGDGLLVYSSGVQFYVKEM